MSPAVVLCPLLGLRVASYYDAVPPGTLVLSRAVWATLAPAARRELLAREAAHHVTQAVYLPPRTRTDYLNAARLEERGRRLALRALVSDAQVRAAFAGGDTYAWELAERWGRSPAWCAARVALFALDWPIWQPWVRGA